MSSWLVLDLRHNQCAVGLLTLERQGPPTWHSEDLLDIYVSADTHNPYSVADLAFFHRRGDKLWKPTLSSVLQDPEVADFESVSALFEEPAQRLSDLLPNTLGVLLREPLRQWWRVPILALIDRAEVQEPLNQYLLRLEREVKLAVVDGPDRAYAGFALWERGNGAVPSAGTRWFCCVPRTDQHEVAREATAAEVEDEFRRYTWEGTRFSLGRARTPPPGIKNVARWRSGRDLERVGAAMFALQWRETLLGMRPVDIQDLQKEIEEREGLLAQLKLILQGLRGGGIWHDPKRKRG